MYKTILQIPIGEKDRLEMATKKREITGVRSAPSHRENPFLVGASAEIVGRKKRYTIASKTDAVVGPDGRYKGTVEHTVSKVVDDAQFVKVFADGIRAMYDLSAPGSKVFRYLFDQVQTSPNVDRIYLYFMDALEEPWSISKPVFYRGLAELLDKNFIAASTNPNMFFLNPAMIWNGDRFRFVQEYRRAKPAERIEQDQMAQLEARGQQRLSLDPEGA